MLAAIIVLYHPDNASLTRLLRKVIPQVDMVIAVDNTPGSSNDASPVPGLFSDQVLYLPLGENMGIATAHNVGIRRAMAAGCSHIVLFDQDSAPSEEMVQALLAAEESLLRRGRKVAAVGPLFLDEKNSRPPCAVRHTWFRVQRVEVEPGSGEPVETDYLISSGSLIRISVLDRVGFMRDDLFIDWVDAEWGFRASRIGYQTYIIPSAKMLHSIGDSAVRLFGREINTHSIVRNFYIVRNGAYLMRDGVANWKVRTHMMVAVPKHIVVHTWLAERRWKCFTAMLRGAWLGASGRLKGSP